MAVPLSTYGNTLTDLQAGTNAAQGLDYSRANAQDAISQQRLEAFLRLRGQQAQIQAQQNAMAQDRALKMQELLQQNQQFGTSQGNALKLAEMDAASRLAVANATNKGMAPGIFENTLVSNQQQQLRADKANAYSAQRKALIAEEKAANDYHYAWANGAAYKQWKATVGTEPDAKRAATARAVLEQKASDEGFTLTPDGGYAPIIPNLIALPGSKGVPPVNPNPPSPLPPVPLPAPETQIPAMFQGGISIGGLPVGGSSPGATPIAPAVDALGGSTVPRSYDFTNPSLPMIGADGSLVIPSAPAAQRFIWTPTGVVPR